MEVTKFVRYAEETRSVTTDLKINVRFQSVGIFHNLISFSNTGWMLCGAVSCI